MHSILSFILSSSASFSRLAASSRILFVIMSLICDISTDCGDIWRDWFFFCCSICFCSVFPVSCGSIICLFPGNHIPDKQLFPDTETLELHTHGVLPALSLLFQGVLLFFGYYHLNFYQP